MPTPLPDAERRRFIAEALNMGVPEDRIRSDLATLEGYGPRTFTSPVPSHIGTELTWQRPGLSTDVPEIPAVQRFGRYGGPAVTTPEERAAEQAKLYGAGKMGLSVGGALAANALAPGAGIIGGTLLRTAGAATGQATGEVGRRLMQGEPLEPGPIAAEAAVAGAGEFVPQVVGSTLARVAGVGRKTIANTLAQPYTTQMRQMMTSPRTFSEMEAGQAVLSRAEDLRGGLPQLQPRAITPGVTDELGIALQGARERAGVSQAYRGTVRGARLESARMYRGRTAESRIESTQAAARARMDKIETLKGVRQGLTKDSSRIGSELNDLLTEAEGRLTGHRVGKVSMLKKATDDGVLIDASGLMRAISGLKDELSQMPGAVQMNARLDRLLDTMMMKYGRPGEMVYGAGARSVGAVTPIQADEILRTIRNEVSDAFNAPNATAAQGAFKNLSAYWRQEFYGGLEGAGQISGEIKAMLDAQEGLRDFLGARTPSSFVARLVRGGAGSEEARAALDAFERTHGTGGRIAARIQETARAYEGGKLGAETRFRTTKEAISTKGREAREAAGMERESRMASA